MKVFYTIYIHNALYYFQLWFMIHLNKLEVMYTGQLFVFGKDPTELCQLSPSAVLGLSSDNIYER